VNTVPKAGSKPGVPVIRVKPGRERSLERLHPWVFSGAVERVEGSPGPGETVRVAAPDGRFLAWAAYSPQSQIRARAWSFAEDAFPDDAWLRARLAAAVERRRTAVPPEAGDALRLVHAESDGLPGLIVDRYGDVLVAQFLAAGVDARRAAIGAALAEVTGCSTVYERSDADVRSLEGLSERTGPLLGDEPLKPIEIVEWGLRYRVDVREGHKTGFYLDQRDNRRRVRALASGREVLNCFAYTGGFAIASLAGGARSVLSLESSAPALGMARANAALNGLDGSAAQWREADVFPELRRLRDRGRSFDLIVLDPPKFAPTARQADAAARGYKDINLNALKLLRPGGLLATFSCSGGVSAELFQKIVAGAAADAGVSASVLERFQAAPDHPARLEFPEGEYLKGLLLRRE
jgi:23S rRNA (cytosine1962-C5)-methyltransferase